MNNPLVGTVRPPEKVFPGLPARSLKKVPRRSESPRKVPEKCDFGDFLNFSRSLGYGVRKNGVHNRCPYRRCGVDTEIPYRLPVWTEFFLFLPVRVARGVDAEFPHRVRIVDRGVERQNLVI